MGGAHRAHGGDRNAYKMVIGKPKGKRQIGITKRSHIITGEREIVFLSPFLI
jgi:hypothetical protein